MSLHTAHGVPRPRTRGRIAALALGAAIALGASLLAAAPAHADTLVPANRVGGLTLEVDGGGRATVITSAAPCPGNTLEGSYRAVLLLADGTQRNLSSADTQFDQFTLDKPVSSTTSVSRWRNAFAGLAENAEAEMVIVCDDWKDPGGFPRPIEADNPYFSETIVVDIEGAGGGTIPGAWHVKDRTETPTKTPTETTLAASGTTATSTTLTASVTPAGATGTVQFTQNGANIETAPVTETGTASISVSGLTAATAYSFAANYSGDSTHDVSVSVAQSVTTLPAVEPVDTATTELGVTVPPVESTEPTGLKIETKPVPAVTLSNGAPRVEGQAWAASGALAGITVNDDRRTAPAGWTLSGSASSFRAGTNEIGADNLKWTPAEVGTTHGDAGPEATGLNVAKVLATGAAAMGQSNVKTTVGAQLSLNVPAGAAAGDYKSVLTLTLI